MEIFAYGSLIVPDINVKFMWKLIKKEDHDWSKWEHYRFYHSVAPWWGGTYEVFKSNCSITGLNRYKTIKVCSEIL